MNEIYERYSALLKSSLSAQDEGDIAKEDSILEILDGLWLSMTLDQREFAEELTRAISSQREVTALPMPKESAVSGVHYSVLIENYFSSLPEITSPPAIQNRNYYSLPTKSIDRTSFAMSQAA